MKKGLIIFGLLIEIFLINLINAGFILAPEGRDYNISFNYAGSEPVKGWINISLQNEDTDSLLTAFNSNMTLINFLEKNDFYCESDSQCSCSPKNCESDYISDNGESTKSFSIGYNEEKIISFLIQGNISSISKAEFNISVANTPSCLNPVKIDILNDDIIEWKSKKYYNDFICTYKGGMGCFNSSESLSAAIIDNAKPYCEKISMVEGGKFSLGSWVKKGSTPWHNGLLNMYLYNLEGSSLGSCALPEPSQNGSEISCSIEYENDGIKDYYVCIQAEADISGYETKKESTGSCGFYAFPGEETEYHDYYIFSKAAKFDYIGQFAFNQDEYEEQGNSGELTDYIFDYISDKYDAKCADGCSIPVRFKAYNNLALDIDISDVKIKYSTGSGPQETNLIYDAAIENAKISSNFLKLDLAKADLLVPSHYGDETLILRLGGDAILEEIIEILAIPKISNLIPSQVPALVSYPFVVFLEKNASNLTYIWDFGDKTSVESGKTNKINHIYSNTGNYSVKVTIKNNFGESSKTFPVKVIPPEEAILDILTRDKAKLVILKKQINSLPDFVRVEVKKSLDIDGMEEDIKTYEEQYENAFDENAYVTLMRSLLEFKVPSSLTISQQIPKDALFLNKKQLDLEILESLGAGQADEKEDYNALINTWLAKSLKASIEAETYALDYDGTKEDFISHIKIILEPNENLGQVYFIVNGEPDKIIFSDESNTKIIEGKAKVIVFDDLSQTTTIELLYPRGIEIGNFPVYISPEFGNLDFGAGPGICNFNKVCEKELKENWKNCRNDCKPYFLTSLFLGILIIVFLIIYIALQEWYKRHYESKLFPDKNQLFNLINFINNSLNQGLRKANIFSNLKDLDWGEEQLRYAWNKFNGKRTGMWEIPVFKWVENKQVKKELEKRQSIPFHRTSQIAERNPRQLRQPRPNLRRLR